MASKGRQQWRDAPASHPGFPIPVEAEDLSSDEWLTQCGDSRHGFRESPRWDREIAVSVVRGRLDTVDAVSTAYGRPTNRHDIVRYFSVRVLRENEYWPLHTPSIYNHEHVGIYAPVDSTDRTRHRRRDASSQDAREI